MITELQTNSGGAGLSTTERDLATAAQLQRMLLPPSPFVSNGWKAVHRFEPAGIVSGDYVDVKRARPQSSETATEDGLATTAPSAMTAGEPLRSPFWVRRDIHMRRASRARGNARRRQITAGLSRRAHRVTAAEWSAVRDNVGRRRRQGSRRAHS